MKLGIVYTPEEQIKVDNIVYILGQPDSSVIDAVFIQVLKQGRRYRVDDIQLKNIGFPVNKAIEKYFEKKYSLTELDQQFIYSEPYIEAILNYYDIVGQHQTWNCVAGELLESIKKFASTNNLIPRKVYDESFEKKSKKIIKKIENS